MYRPSASPVRSVTIVLPACTNVHVCVCARCVCGVGAYACVCDCIFDCVRDFIHVTMCFYWYAGVVAAQWRDLRDVRAMTSWAPAAEQMSDEQKKSSFELEVRYASSWSLFSALLLSMSLFLSPLPLPSSSLLLWGPSSHLLDLHVFINVTSLYLYVYLSLYLCL